MFWLWIRSVIKLCCVKARYEARGLERPFGVASCGSSSYALTTCVRKTSGSRVRPGDFVWPSSAILRLRPHSYRVAQMPNQHGLSRHIPSDIARQVRQRSKFGCVICRAGFYEYEHIDPEFANAREHDPARICCLCASCHGAVTRGQRSKASVTAAYQAVQTSTLEQVGNPFGPIDFHGGAAELRIGGLCYSPLVRVVLRFHGTDIIRVEPGDQGVPGGISAVFTNDAGVPILWLDSNAWEGSTENWDIQVVGQRITVRAQDERVALRLRLDPPGVIVVENLDMRVGDSHLLATEHAYAAGRYVGEGSAAWLFANVAIDQSTEHGCAIEFAEPDELRLRHQATRQQSQYLATTAEDFVTSSGAGVMWIPAGIAVASMCGGFRTYVEVRGIRPLDGMRRVVARGADALVRYIGTGDE